MRAILAIGLSALMLSGCSTTAATFYRTPSKPNLTALCRSYLNPEISDRYRQDLADEIARRGEYVDDCQGKVTAQNVAIGAVAIIAGATAIGIACANNACPSGGAAPRQSDDRDCYGGPGDGPFYVHGPVQVGPMDPWDLDRDNDGVGCELGDYGA